MGRVLILSLSTGHDARFTSVIRVCVYVWCVCVCGESDGGVVVCVCVCGGG